MRRLFPPGMARAVARLLAVTCPLAFPAPPAASRGLGSVLGEVDGSGNVTATRKLDVYGAVRATTGTATSNHAFVGALGHPSEAETGRCCGTRSNLIG